MGGELAIAGHAGDPQTRTRRPAARRRLRLRGAARGSDTAHRLPRCGDRHLCVVEVSNFSGVWRDVFRTWWLPLLVPQHLVHYTPQTLRRTLEAAGFRVDHPHTAMFYPAESTASLGLWLNRLLRRPIRGYRLRWTRPDALLLIAVLLAWWCAVEVPLQVLFKLLGRTGHQLMAGYHVDRP